MKNEFLRCAPALRPCVSLTFCLLLFLSLFSFNMLDAQVADPMPAQCSGMMEEASLAASPVSTCNNSSSLWSSNSRHVPLPDARQIFVRANFIILQKQDGSGNFQDIPEHRAFLDDWFNQCNSRFTNLWGTSNCGPKVSDVKVQIVPNWVFLPDPNPSEYNWNNDNQPGNNKCPGTNWWLNQLDATINNNPSIPRGINVYLTVDGSVYNQMVVLGSIDNPETAGMTYTWCSELSSKTDLNKPSRIHIPNLFLKYWWFEHFIVAGQPFSVTRQWIVGEGGIFAHEFGHSFIDCYIHKSRCTNHLMTASGGDKSVMLEDDAGCIHRNLAFSNLRQFIDCSEKYSPLNSSNSSSTYDRVVTADEVWDVDMRVYSNITVKTGATLTVNCKLLMPLDGLIKVERGARLIVDGGTITKANTCSSNQYWGAISVSGNNNKIQPLLTGTLATDDAGVVILKNQGLIEGAIVGVTTQRVFGAFEPSYWGGLVDVNDFTFKNCQKGVEFTKYDYPNRSKFNKAKFTRTSTGTSLSGVTIWDTDGISFEESTFDGMSDQGIWAWDAVFNVKKKNRFSGSKIAILAGGSAPLQGKVQIGEIGAVDMDQNVFDNNVVGVRATSNANVEIFSNKFSDSNFDVAINGTTKSLIVNNLFSKAAAGNQFDNTGNNSNETRCNSYTNNTVGINIVGANPGFLFREEDFSTLTHDLFLEGPSSNPGSVQVFQGIFGGARWNYFTTLQKQNIKTSTVVPNNNTSLFYYFHPDPAINSRLKPFCGLTDNCSQGIPHSNFQNIMTDGQGISNCLFPAVVCNTKPCLDAVRLDISQKTTQYGANPTDAQKAELEQLVTRREDVTDKLITDYIDTNNWVAVEALLNEDLTATNRRRLVGAKLSQKQYAAATTLLTTFPQNSIDDEYFVQIQNINAERLANPAFTLSTNQKVVLDNIASSSSKEAGYAQTLLGILTGQVFMPILPDLGKLEDGKERSNLAEDSNIVSELEVSPNPVSETLQVKIVRGKEAPLELYSIELRGVSTGRICYSATGNGAGNWNIPVSEFPAGIYLVQVRNFTTGEVRQQKVVIQH